MRMTHFLSVLSIIAISLTATAASAQQRDDSSRSGESSNRQQSEQTRPAQGQVRQISGRIIRTKQVEARGDDRKVLVALVEGRDGRRQIVDFGFTKQLNLNLRSGDGVGVVGKLTRTGDYSVLRATKVRTHDDTVTIRRTSGERAQRGNLQSLARDLSGDMRSRGYQVSQDSRRVQGTVAGRRTVQLRNSDQRNQIVRVRGSQGDYHVVDLGPIERLDANLREGQRITVVGRTANLERGAVLLASRFSVGGDEMQTVERGRAGRNPGRRNGESREDASRQANRQR